MQIDTDGLEILDRADCLGLLGRVALGRVGISSGALPTILPIGYRLVDERILFRTSPGTVLDVATTNAIVAFQVDEVDPATHTGWSVVVTGLATEVTTPHDLAQVADAGIPYWAPHASGGRILELSTEMMSGRRLVPSLPAGRT